MRLMQFVGSDGARAVAAIGDDGAPRTVRGATSVRDLALEAHRSKRSLAASVEAHGLGEAVDYDRLIAEKRLLLPLDHPEPSRVIVALTGLTHLGSAQSRDSMHAKLAGRRPQRFHEDVQARDRRRQAEEGRDRRAARMGL